ncbi:unnamed protein product [Cuscuta europaea]|uniref:Uncharacterized protein n=1 Tax=Cuscuta europaea TaxID=41803 RepID=A0A9P0Z0X5_CUSEU|nr:unnamed protein product [Cuscuta europaea]
MIGPHTQLRKTMNGASPSTSPRISFSFSSAHHYPAHSHSDFHFRNFEGEISAAASSADEIFSNGGFILPLRQRDLQAPKDEKVMKSQQQSKPAAAAFWRSGSRRRRQSEMQNAAGDQQLKRGSVWSFQPLPRSYSTGSEQTSKEKAHRLKSASCSSSSSSSSCSFYEFPLSTSSQKRTANPGNGAVRINPVLNVPPPSCISMGTRNLFGLGSLFRSGNKDKKKATRK